jgi:hypothetical protein
MYIITINRHLDPLSYAVSRQESGTAVSSGPRERSQRGSERKSLAAKRNLFQSRHGLQQVDVISMAGNTAGFPFGKISFFWDIIFHGLAEGN